MKSTAGDIAFRAGKWPIQTLALISTLVFVTYVVIVELNPSALPSTLARSYVVHSAGNWESTTDLQSAGAAGLPRFTGAPVTLPETASPAVRRFLAAKLDADDVKTTKAGISARVVLPDTQVALLLDELRVFDVDGEKWELQTTPSWLAYSRFYLSRITDLVHTASWLEIAFVSIGWAGMYYTFFGLFRQLRALGSRTFLFLAALMSSGLAFLSAYAITVVAGVNVPKLVMVQGLPFFVLTVGFNNKVTLAREALFNPERVTAAEAVQRAVTAKFYGFLRESAFETMGMFLLGCVTGITDLREFLVLAVLVLVLDLFFLVTFFAANVSLKVAMVQVQRNDAVRRTLQEDGVSRDVAGAYADEVLHSSHKARAAKFTHLRWFGGSLRLILVFGLMGINWLHVVQFPISLSVNRADLAAVHISDYANRLPLPCVFTIVPTLRFSPASPGSLILNGALSFMHSAVATRAALLALVLSLVCNGYLAGLVISQGNSAPLFLEVPSTEKSSPRPKSRSKSVLESPKPSPSLSGGAAFDPLPKGSAKHRKDGRAKQPATEPAQAANAQAANAQPKQPGAATKPVLETEAGAESRADTSIDTRTDTSTDASTDTSTDTSDVELRSLEEAEAELKAGNAVNLADEELIALSTSGKLPLYALEKQLKDTTRAVVIRRAAVSRLSTTQTLEHSELPWKDYNYDRVLGACCENVIGYLPLPLGVAGPVIIDGKEYYLPMATTEGVLVASTMRGCKALNAGGGVVTEILGDGMTRGPCVTFGTAARAAKCKIYLDSAEGTRAMERAFNSTSRFARLDSLKTALAGPFLYIRFRAQTGDAMGMNMISKGTERALQVLAEECGFEDMTIVSVSGNYCTDKKAAAVNWIEGRGKSVVAEALVPGNVVRKVLKTGVDELVELNMAKNLVGSSVAGVLGGFNAHAANLVAALFLATGQDPAQVVEGSNCMTLMSNVEGDLQISVTMPSLEVGTIGGGTILEPQAAMLNMLGVRGPHISQPGENARQLARIVATAVLAGELSLNSALAAGHLVQSHMAHNRAKAPPK